MTAKDNTTKPELLPCPFCGEEANIHTSYNHYFPQRVSHRTFYASCYGCMNATAEWKTKKTAIKRWNRRA